MTPQLLTITLAVLILLVLLAERVAGKHNLRKTYAAYAKSHQGTFKPGRVAAPEPLSILGAIGHKGSVSNLITGTLRGLPFRMFDYTISFLNFEKQRVEDFSYLVYELELGIPLPHIFLNGVHNDSSRSLRMLGKYIDRNNRLELEGDFNDYFQAYIETDQQISALSILTPDNMRALIDHGLRFDIEFLAGRMHLITSLGHRNSVAQLQDYDLAIKSVLKNILPGLAVLRHVPSRKMLGIREPTSIKR